MTNNDDIYASYYVDNNNFCYYRNMVKSQWKSVKLFRKTKDYLVYDNFLNEEECSNITNFIEEFDNWKRNNDVQTPMYSMKGWFGKLNNIDKDKDPINLFQYKLGTLFKESREELINKHKKQLEAE